MLVLTAQRRHKHSLPFLPEEAAWYPSSEPAQTLCGCHCLVG